MLKLTILILSLGLATRQAVSKLTGETEFDEDEGQEWDIFNINQGEGLALLEGDILQDETGGRNTMLGEEYRWPTTIPYYLEDNLDMNAKGVILKAFDQYRLKTCIDFTPWRGEKNYISVFKGSGCFSSVGNQHAGKQRLSIGRNCDRLGTVEHEFLHALGFWHEQSRADRDDYVNIVWDQIEPGKEHNFKTRDDSESSALGVPYDYGSVMHYSKTSFNVASKPTIVTKIPQFMDVIGQRMGFSANDLAKLRILYNCTKSSTFVDSCSFEEENICGMIQGPSEAKWERRNSVTGGPPSDTTNMGQCKGQGHFMHFSTTSAEPGDRTLLESRWLYPKPGAQCLQFFLHNTGATDDLLNIWVREYDQDNPSGRMRLFKTISGGTMDSWEMHNVNLEVTQKSRIVFEGVRGTGPSKGGFSLDDINVASSKCLQHIWHIRNITKLMATTKPGTKLYSPRFLSPTGYTYQVGVYLNGKDDRPDYIGIYLHLVSGPNDHNLKWPCPWQQATMVLMDQHPDIRQQMNNHRMVTTDPEKLSSDGELYWDDPKKVGSKVSASDGTYFYRGPGYGTSSFLTHSRLNSRNYIKGDDAYFLFSMEDISDLLAPQPVARSAVLMRVEDQSASQGGAKSSTTIIVALAVVVLAVSVLLLVGAAWRINRRRRQRGQQAQEIKTISPP